MTINQSEALSSLCIILVKLNRPLSPHWQGVYAWSMQGPFRGGRYDPASYVSVAKGETEKKWRVLLFQRLDLAFFPNCETSESQDWHTSHSSSYCHLDANAANEGECTLLGRVNSPSRLTKQIWDRLLHFWKSDLVPFKSSNVVTALCGCELWLVRYAAVNRNSWNPLQLEVIAVQVLELVLNVMVWSYNLQKTTIWS